MSDESRDDDADLAVDWRELRRAALFFTMCLALVVVLGVVGLYH